MEEQETDFDLILHQLKVQNERLSESCTHISALSFKLKSKETDKNEGAPSSPKPTNDKGIISEINTQIGIFNNLNNLLSDTRYHLQTMVKL
jgi:hypothetical protein